EKHLTPRTKALLINFPTNPTGAVLNADDLKDISEFAIEHNLVLITDEVYSELTYDTKHVSIATIPEMKERTIFLHGLSKGWAMTGFRMGIACAPQPLIEAMMKIHQYTMMCAPILSQIAAIEAFTNGKEAVTEMRNEYNERRLYICDELNKMGLECATPKGAFYVFPSIAKFGLSSHDFAMRLLNEESVACVPGSAFGAAGEGFLRCSYATSMDEIKEAMPRMANFVKKLM
ncbi:MAG: aminotransferase class I/II-fold pyridoxal phosphate-dependent enzyme, partial [Kiritimatiellae bacterium]|nr:aminotransferase class I/II-fold pyridoxal phosphate-dependent enzyme [Kiritimatiellia bacterium]